MFMLHVNAPKYRGPAQGLYRYLSDSDNIHKTECWNYI